MRELSRAGGSYTLGGGRALLGAAEADRLLGERYAFINVWRPICDGPVMDVPLAVCDGRSMQEEDFAACKLVYPDRVGETHIVRHQPSHRWYWYSVRAGLAACTCLLKRSTEIPPSWRAEALLAPTALATVTAVGTDARRGAAAQVLGLGGRQWRRGALHGTHRFRQPAQ
eukprot:COSAG01_NODE_4680_length_4821_cov_3.614994_2_plen_170_part_00